MTAEEAHRLEILETFEAWQRKPLLRSSYKQFHSYIKSQLSDVGGLTVELGSGIGMMKETIPDCITTDIFNSDWIDQVESAYTLSFADESVANLILFDVWHHLEFPGMAVDEFKRVLKPGGKIILFEPAALSALGYIVYHFFHHEPIFSPEPAIWNKVDLSKIQNSKYYASQGNAWKNFVQGETPEQALTPLIIDKIIFRCSLEYLASGGFRKNQLLPSFLKTPLKHLSSILDCVPKAFSTRLLISLKKENPY